MDLLLAGTIELQLAGIEKAGFSVSHSFTAHEIFGRIMFGRVALKLRCSKRYCPKNGGVFGNSSGTAERRGALHRAQCWRAL